MHLKRLELHGYKSFARKTEFVFDRGITAIVGPNGSGKSNIADAIRWALGETRITQLRAKVTDDLIFAGSDQRARLGMARVAMTLDNSDGSLPIRYTEVTVERRAYRDGQNEYLINGTKVRLRDIVELLAEGGLTRDTYTVIGQGLVDTMLSLRPQERRGLIDVAAGIRPLQDKRDRALGQLEEMQANLIRVRDILAELAPRLRRLEKQAERARQGAEVADELADALQVWYGHQWHLARQALADATARLDAKREAVAEHRAAASALERQIETWRDREEEQAETLATLRTAYSRVRTEHESVSRDVAVREERAALLEQRNDELARELAAIQTQYAERERGLAASEARLAELKVEAGTRAERLDGLKQEHRQFQQRRSEVVFALDHARQQNLDLASAVANLRNRLATLGERRATLARERSTHSSAIAEQESKIAQHREHIERGEQAVEAGVARRSDLHSDQQACETELEATRGRLETLKARLDTTRRHLDQLRARHDALAEARRSGLHGASGAMHLLDSRSEVSGMIDSVVRLLRVPDHLATAIEAALGSLLNAVVVETWADAFGALAWLKEEQAGQVTLIVRQTELGSDGSALPALDFNTAGVLGRAHDLVTSQPGTQFLLPLLLGRTIVVENVQAARQLLRDPVAAAMPRLTLVTLDGTVVQSSGQVAGGTAQSGILRLERVWRELPSRVARAEMVTEKVEATLAHQHRRVEVLVEKRTHLEHQMLETQGALQAAQDGIAAEQRIVETLQQECAWRRDIVGQRTRELEGVDQQIDTTTRELGAAEERQLHEEQRVAALAAELDQLDAQVDPTEMVELEKNVAAENQRRQNQEVRHRELENDLRAMAEQINAKESQVDDVREQLATLRPGTEELRAREQEQAAELKRMQAEIQPLEDTLRSMRRDVRDLDRQVVTARQALHGAEIEASQAGAEVERRQDRLTALRDKIADDIELAAVGEEIPQQLALALDGAIEALPIVTEVPAGLEKKVARLRRQLRQIGSASPEIVAEYEETKTRYDFLRSQVEDLEEAARDLREVIAELNSVMDERFDVTFEAVATAFAKYFTRLFGGGDARLALDMEEDASTVTDGPGLVITARPPGKRSQSLALLSGGERALTAVALLFALLEISPTPYCVLDEVDAMLDEANIGRFRSTLESLAEESQFIIITHNRGTVQAANTLYGISMGADGVSQAISLRLDDLEPVPA